MRAAVSWTRMGVSAACLAAATEPSLQIDIFFQSSSQALLIQLSSTSTIQLTQYQNHCLAKNFSCSGKDLYRMQLPYPFSLLEFPFVPFPANCTLHTYIHLLYRSTQGFSVEYVTK